MGIESILSLGMPDAIVIGGGHNGLVAASYLGRAGLSVTVLERRALLGGACVTEELWPGFKISRGAYVAGLLRPAVVRELDLERHGLALLPRRPSSFTPLLDGRSLTLSPEAGVSEASIRHFSSADAARYAEYEDLLSVAARLIEPLLDEPPPEPGSLSLSDLRALGRSAGRALRDRKKIAAALEVLLAPGRDTLMRFFESEPLRSTLATDAVIGAWASPSTPGSGYVLLHHVMGETHGERGVWAYVRGGMGGLAEALATSARAAGVTIREEATVSQVLTEENRVIGVALESGEVLHSGLVLSNADPYHTFRELLPEASLPDDFNRSLDTLDFKSPVAKINLALDRLPRFSASTGDGLQPEHAATIHVGAGDLDAMDASFEAARRGELPELPMIELTLPSSLDTSLAPEGRHVASMFVQHVPDASAAWDGAMRDRLRTRVFALMDEVAPGFSSSVLHHEILAPPDIERIFGMRGGNIFHGAMSLDKLLFARPVVGYARYRTPVEGLYLCGAGAHPGGGVMGACGRNAAREALRRGTRNKRTRT